MYDDHDRLINGWWIVILVLGIIGAVLLGTLLDNRRNEQRDVVCKQKLGTEWNYVPQYGSTGLCVTRDGKIIYYLILDK